MSSQKNRDKTYKFQRISYLMGEIFGTKASKNNRVKYRIILEEHEAKLLKNHLKNVHIFPEEMCLHPTNIIEKGIQKSAKYFIIPKSLKSRKKTRYTKISYQKIETNKQAFFIIVANKNLFY
jgi:hypothetical protein